MHASFGLICPIRFCFDNRQCVSRNSSATRLQISSERASNHHVTCVSQRYHLASSTEQTLAAVMVITAPYTPVSCVLCPGQPGKFGCPHRWLATSNRHGSSAYAILANHISQTTHAMPVPDPHVKTELVLAGMAANQAHHLGCAPAARHSSNHRLDKRLPNALLHYQCQTTFMRRHSTPVVQAPPLTTRTRTFRNTG